jgi:hypothetical protein
MIATTMLALPALLLAPVGTPLDADVFDASQLPSVVFDVVAPHDFAAVDLTPAMFTIEEGRVQAVEKVDPATVAVSLVIDDSPTMSKQAVQDSQGASVELIRNVGPGARVSLSTPSGLVTALTTDQQASLARIAGIVAGSPDVMKLPDLVVDAAQRLAAAPLTDRHLVVVLGSAFPDGPQLQALRDIIIPAGVRLDVVAASGLDSGPIAELATASGGISPVLPKPVGEMDAVTQAIRDRYHVSATVDGPGPHDVALNVGGQTFGATLDIPVAPAAAPATTPTPTTPTSAAPSGSIGPTATPTTAAATSTPAATVPSSSVTTSSGSSGSSGMGRGARILIALLLLAVAIAAWTTWIVLRRRALAAAKRRTARANARARAEAETQQTDVEPLAEEPQADEPVLLIDPVDDLASPPNDPGLAEPVATEAGLPEPEPAADDAEVAAPVADAESEADTATVEAGAVASAVAPPMSMRAARRARKKARRKLGEAAAIAATGAVAEDSPEAMPQPSGEPEPEAVELEPARIVLAPEREPVALEPELEPEPELAAVASEPEHEPEAEPAAVASEPELEPESEPAVVQFEPEPVVLEPEPEAEPRPELIAAEVEPELEPAQMGVEPESEPADDENEPADEAEQARQADDADQTGQSDEAQQAEQADEAQPAVQVDEAEQAEQADEVELAEQADEVELAEQVDEAELAEQADEAELAEQADEAELAEQPAVAARRGRTLTERPRRQTNRRPTPEPPAPPEPAPTIDRPSRRGRRVYPSDRTPGQRTRRGSPADVPKRARSRRRFKDIPLIEPEPPSNGLPLPEEPDWVTSGDLSLCRSTGQVFANGREVSLTASEFGALELLITGGNDGVARDALQAAVGDQDPDVVVAQLRRKTGQRGRATAMRRERVLRYFLADDGEPSD